MCEKITDRDTSDDGRDYILEDMVEEMGLLGAGDPEIEQAILDAQDGDHYLWGVLERIVFYTE